MKTVFQWVERIAPYVLRISLGLVLLWIGALHLQNPHPIVVLLSLSLPFLASSAFVYVLGALEVIAGVLLIAGLWVRYVGLATLVLFAGTLTIFVIAPAVTGFPILTLTGQFLLKDVVLASAAITVAATDAARHAAKQGAVDRSRSSRLRSRPLNNWRDEVPSSSDSGDVERPYACSSHQRGVMKTSCCRIYAAHWQQMLVRRGVFLAQKQHLQSRSRCVPTRLPPAAQRPPTGERTAHLERLGAAPGSTLRSARPGRLSASGSRPTPVSLRGSRAAGANRARAISCASLVEIGAAGLTLLLLRPLPLFALQGSLLILGMVVVALAWGAGPSLVATLVGTALLELLVVPPYASRLLQGMADSRSGVVALLVGCSISLIAGQRGRARRQAEEWASCAPRRKSQE